MYLKKVEIEFANKNMYQDHTHKKIKDLIAVFAP